MDAKGRTKQIQREVSAAQARRERDREQVNTEKDIAAFVERVTKRLNEPKGSRRARHRAAFTAVRPLIEGALRHGHTIKATWEALRDEGKLSMTYETFRSYCRRLELGHAEARQEVSSPLPDAHGAVRAAARPPIATQTRPNPLEPQGDARPRGFRHDPVPRTKDIYG